MDSRRSVQTQRQGSVSLVGTVHGSPLSHDRVQTCIRERRPDVVAVELDPYLFRAYWEEERLSAVRLAEDGATFRGLLAFLLTTPRGGSLGPVGRRRGDADVVPAIREAFEQNASVALVDRPTATTMNRLGAELFSISAASTLVRRLVRSAERADYVDRIAASVDTLIELGFDDEFDASDSFLWFESLSVDEMTELVEAFETAFPLVLRVMVRERDRHIAGRLIWLTDEGHDVVAVLGKAHVPGVAAHLEAPGTLPPRLVTAPPMVTATRRDVRPAVSTGRF